VISEHRPEACIQAFSAKQHTEKHFYEQKERSVNIALKLVYKHLVPNNMMRNRRDLQDFAGNRKDLHGFIMICKDLQGFARIYIGRICQDLLGFASI
jgi:hypothetical protein